MTKAEKKDIVFVLSKEFSRLYSLGVISFAFPYESEDITDEADLTDIIERIFISVYTNAIAQNWYPNKNLIDEQIYVLDTIQSILIEYETRNALNDVSYNPVYTISESLKARIKNVR